MEYQAKLNESTHLFYIAFQVLKVLLKNLFIIQSPGLLLLIVLHQFLTTTTDVIFHNFLELHSTLSEARVFHECPFLLID